MPNLLTCTFFNTISAQSTQKLNKILKLILFREEKKESILSKMPTLEKDTSRRWND